MGIINFIGLLSLIYMVTAGAAPIQFIKRLIGVHNDDNPKHLALQVIQKLINCSMCFGFWAGLVYYYFIGVDSFILIACVVSVCAEIFHRLIEFILTFVLPAKWKI